MKKICVLLLLVVLTGCNKKVENKSLKNDIKKDEVIEEKIPVEKEEIITYKDDNDIRFSIYRSINGTYMKTVDYSDYWYNNTDISYYSIFYSLDDVLYSYNFKNDFINLKNNFKTQKAKHGFNFQFTTTEGEINKTIINPDDVWEIFPYIQIYLYDDIFNAGKSWYSHTEQSQVNNDTLFTSFKITMTDPTKIVSDIKVTAFTYDTDDDFKDNKYIGNSYYEFNLKKL